jgi:signal transduction histidine kinase
LVVGAAVSWWASNIAGLTDRLFYVRADLGGLAFVLGAMLSVLLAARSLQRQRLEDASQRREAQVRSDAAEERRRFLQRLDHELESPLTAIRAGLANAHSEESAPAQQEAWASVEAQVVRIRQLASDLRKLAELETRTLELGPLDVKDLLSEAIALAQEQPGAGVRHINLTLPEVPWPLPPVKGDRHLLLLAVFNLLDNALKFTRPGDTVEVRAFEDRAAVVVEVADTGPGIAPDDEPYVWEELYRGEASRGIPGSGLGLALARAIVERHGGGTSLRSRVEQGTVVALRLPVV